MSSTIGPYHPSTVEEILPELPSSIPDPEDERPSADEILPARPDSSNPPIILGCAVFGYGIYSSQSFVQGGDPVRVIRYALRCGINAFDTSPWYHPSEIVLGRVFDALKDEYPRESYQLITKLGKYGPKVKHHTYDKESVRQSVERSLKRLRTDYLDVVYLHDVEFVSSHPFPCPGGNHLLALPSTSSDLQKSATPSDPFNLLPPHTPLGPGDSQILEGLTTLSDLRAEGKVKRIGIAGYPLPVLLRLSLLASAHHIQIDIVQTYAQQTILNPSLVSGYLSAFENAGVQALTNAAPLAMGILTASGGPEWHPAKNERDGMVEACAEAVRVCKERGTSIEQVALNYGYKEVKMGNGEVVPVVIGCKSIDEIKRTVKQWREVNVPGVRDESESGKVQAVEDEVIRLFEDRGVKGVSWSSPGQGAL